MLDTKIEFYVSEDRIKEFRKIQHKYMYMMANELEENNFLPVPLIISAGKLYNKDEYIKNFCQEIQLHNMETLN